MGAMPKSNEIKLIRVYDAPLPMLWDAWANSDKISKWWGPRGFSLTTHNKDFKSGGHWNYTMHGPDGINYPNITHYLEVEKYSHLVYDHGASADQPPMFRVQVHFSDLKGKSKMEMALILPTPEAAEETRKFIKSASGDSTWDRLSEFLSKEASGKEEFVINRSFPVSIDLMFELWTDPEKLAAWLPPTGFKMKFLRSEIKPGGSIFYEMYNDSNIKMFGRAEYLEVVKPNRIVYLQQFCDENEKTIRHPMSATWPETMRTSIILAEEGPQQTRVKIIWEAHGQVKKEELDTFVLARAGMTQGWTGSFNKLEEFILTQAKTL